MRVRHAASALAALAVLAAAACGTTVPVAQQQLGNQEEQAGAGSAAGTTAPNAPSITVDPVTGDVVPDSSPGTSTGSTPRDERPTSDPVDPTSVAVEPSSPGVTATRITIGLTYYQSAKAANAAVGANVDTGDPIAGTRLLVKEMNARGGIAGRQVTLLAYAVDPQSTASYSSEGQAACAFFTQDNKVFAVINGAPAADQRACLEKAGVASLGGGLISAPRSAHEFDVYGSRLERVFAVLPQQLAANTYFAPWDRVSGKPGAGKVKVGIVTSDGPEDRVPVEKVLIPAFRGLGHAPAPEDVIGITPPGGFSDDGAVVAAIDGAVLKLNADGVTHVFLNDGNGSLSLLFQTYASSQGYYPRYSGSTGNGWQTLLSAGSIPAKTLNGAMGIGWQPLLDLPYSSGDGPFSTPARHACLALFAKGGQAATSAAQAAGQAEGCDVAFFLSHALRTVHGSLNLGVLSQEVNALGTSYPTASGLGTRFSSSQHDGTGTYSFFSFQGSCGCMKYSGQLLSAPK